MTNEKTIPPMFSLPDKTDIGSFTTAIIPTVTTTGPITPIPPALEVRPFFRGVMPLPPSVNESYKVVRVPLRDGRVAHRLGSTPELEQFKRDAPIYLARASRSFTDFQILESLRNTRIKTPLGVRIQGYFLSEWRRDLDGILKASIDAAFDFLRINDNQVVKLEAEKLVDSIDPRVEIEIRTITR